MGTDEMHPLPQCTGVGISSPFEAVGSKRKRFLFLIHQKPEEFPNKGLILINRRMQESTYIRFLLLQ